MRIGVDADFIESVGFFPRQRVKFGDRFQFLAEERQSPGAVFKVGRENFQAVAAHPERAALKRLIVAFVLLRDQVGHHGALVVFVPDLKSCVIAP